MSNHHPDVVVEPLEIEGVGSHHDNEDDNDDGQQVFSSRRSRSNDDEGVTPVVVGGPRNLNDQDDDDDDDDLDFDYKKRHALAEVSTATTNDKTHRRNHESRHHQHDSSQDGEKACFADGGGSGASTGASSSSTAAESLSSPNRTTTTPWRSPLLLCWMLPELCKGGCRNITSHWQIIVAGQALSFLMAGTGAAQATMKFKCNLSAPMFTIGLMYAALAFNLIPTYRQAANYERIRVTTTHNFASSMEAAAVPPAPLHSFLGIPLQGSPAVYLMNAVLDVYANYFTVLAYRYTTITSVTLFDALAIPAAMILSRFFLKRSYSTLHYLAVFSCMLGIIFNVLQDYEDEEAFQHEQALEAAEQIEKLIAANHTSASHSLDSGTTDNDDQWDGGYGQTVTTITVNYDKDDYPQRLRGDVLAITGGILFGVTKVLGEAAVRHMGDPNEYLGMVGLFATIICAVQAFFMERNDIAAFFKPYQEPADADLSTSNSTTTTMDDDLAKTCSDESSNWLLIAFVVTSICVYMGNARFLTVSEATFLNLSFLTGDLWSVGFSIIFEGIIPKPMFFVALLFIVAGVFLYEMSPSPIKEDRHKEQQQQRHHHHAHGDDEDDDDEEEDDDDDDETDGRQHVQSRSPNHLHRTHQPLATSPTKVIQKNIV